jgi:DNA-binding protein HU-alpha
MATKKNTTTARKPVANKTAATAGTEAAVDLPEGAEADAQQAVAKAPSLKIRDLVTRVVDATGNKKKDVKELVEATLKALGDALSAGEDLNLPGLGRARVARRTEKDGASLMTLKVKRGPHRNKHADEPLAEDVEDS